MSLELKVFKNTEASFPLVSYLQISALSSTGLLVCPDLKEFISSRTDGKIQWYKVMLRNVYATNLRLDGCRTHLIEDHHEDTENCIFRHIVLIKMAMISIVYWYFCGLDKVHVGRLRNDFRVHNC